MHHPEILMTAGALPSTMADPSTSPGKTANGRVGFDSPFGPSGMTLRSGHQQNFPGVIFRVIANVTPVLTRHVSHANMLSLDKQYPFRATRVLAAIAIRARRRRL